MQNTSLEGRQHYFGQTQEIFDRLNYELGDNWDYDNGCFDTILERDGGETIYLRVPFHVLDGQLDSRNAYVEFQTPYVIKHVVNLGLDEGGDALASASGFSQFQEPLDKDGNIIKEEKWAEAGREAVEVIEQYIPERQTEEETETEEDNQQTETSTD
nr:YugN family protein [Bacillus piscicola]